MQFKSQTYVIIGLMIAGAFARLIPHIPNFTPTEGLALFGAAYAGKKYFAVIFPVIMLYLSDLIINNTIARSFFVNHEGFIWFSNYMIYNTLAVIAIVFVCTRLLTKISVLTVGGSAIAASLIFFLITNFGCWAGSETSFYSMDLNGLLMAYIAGLPFLRTSLISNLFFTAILFGSYEIIKSFSFGRETTS